MQTDRAGLGLLTVLSSRGRNYHLARIVGSRPREACLYAEPPA